MLNEELILSGKICPYCGKETVLTDSAEIYGTSYVPSPKKGKATIVSISYACLCHACQFTKL